LKWPMPYSAVVACLAACLTGCATTTPQRTSPTALTAVHSPARHVPTRAGCPLGRLLPHGEAIAIDYVDFLRLGGRMYIANGKPVRASELGRVITHIRCSLIAEEDQRRGEPPLINRTASFLRVGSGVYEVQGYPARCRLAAYLRGRLQLYFAQTTVHHHTSPVPCAFDRIRARHLRSSGS